MAFRECGTVLEKADDTLVVEINQPSMCKGCTACSATPRVPRKVKVPAQPGIDEGDQVWIESVPGDMLKSVLLVFLLPTLGLFAGIAAAYYFLSQPSDIVYFICAVLGAAGAFLIAKTVAGHIISFNKNVTKKIS